MQYAPILSEYTPLLKKNQGICVLHHHEDVAFWEQIIEIINLLPENVKHIYMELPDPNSIEKKFPFNDLDVTVHFISTCLHEGINPSENFKKIGLMLGKLLKAVTTSNMTAYFVDHPQHTEKSIDERNEYMARCIRYLNTKLETNEKYIVITGVGHYGLACSLNIPTIALVSKTKNNNRHVIGYRAISHNTSIYLASCLEKALTKADALINTAISPFQNKTGEAFIYPGENNLSVDIIEKINELQQITNLGISLEIGRPIIKENNRNNFFYSKESSSIRLIISKRDIATNFSELYSALSNTFYTDFPLIFCGIKNRKSNSIELNDTIIKITFINDKSFKDTISKLYEIAISLKEPEDTLLVKK